MSMQRVFVVLALGIWLSACLSEVPAVSESEPRDDEASQGAELLMPFKTELKQALQAGMSEGPERAIEVCRDKAPAIAAALSTEGVRMGRASHKLRNPANEGPEWVDAVLEAYLHSETREPAEVALENGYIGYAEPIAIQPLCLTCHGEALAPGIAETIAQLYPEDRATGFSDGDLRGVFWVEFPTRK